MLWHFMQGDKGRGFIGGVRVDSVDNTSSMPYECWIGVSGYGLVGF